MKIKILLLAIFVFCKTTFAQTPKDSLLLVKAIAVMKESDFEAANKYLKKVSASGKNSINFLVLRAVNYEYSKNYKLARKDYDSLYVKTSDMKYKQKSENTLLVEKRIRQLDSIRNNCKVCRGIGYYTMEYNCGLCTNGISGQGSCSRCNGSGERRCNACQGEGKIVKNISFTSQGVTTTSTVEQSCTACNSKGSFFCNTCSGTGFVSQRCNYCNGKGTIPKKVICPLHK